VLRSILITVVGHRPRAANIVTNAPALFEDARHRRLFGIHCCLGSRISVLGIILRSMLSRMDAKYKEDTMENLQVIEIVAHATPGADIGHCYRDALRLATAEWRNVRFTHNSKEYYVSVNDLAGTILVGQAKVK
jgi:hypothetical protein